MFSTARVDFIRHALSGAVDRWQDEQTLPKRDLLRDSLLLLEQGEELDDNQRILLLRSALAQQKGVITALRHQNDAERCAVALCDALLNPQNSFTPADLRRWIQADRQTLPWRAALRDELLAAQRSALLNQRGRVASLLAVLRGVQPSPADSSPKSRSATNRNNHPGSDDYYRLTSPSRSTMYLDQNTLDGADLSDRWALVPEVTEAELAQIVDETAAPPSSNLRLLMAGILLLAVIGYFGYQLWSNWALRPRSFSAEVALTAWLPPLDVPSGSTAPLIVRTILIERTEVTNAQYRACIAAGRCVWPDQRDSATRPDYLTQRLYADFPVVNVSWQAAKDYCDWLGKRLPSVEEWENAASFAPATNRRFAYPWGDRYDRSFVIGAEAGFADTMAVSSRRPTGNSPIGLDDMAGNVAEWTTAVIDDNGAPKRLVKGGSYRDNAEQLFASARELVGLDEAQPWIGFRCVLDQTNP